MENKLSSAKQIDAIGTVASKLNQAGLTGLANSLSTNASIATTGATSVTDPAQPLQTGSAVLSAVTPNAISRIANYSRREAGRILALSDSGTPVNTELVSTARVATNQGTLTDEDPEAMQINTMYGKMAEIGDSAAFYESFPAWGKKSEEERNEIVKNAKTVVTQGSLDITNHPELVGIEASYQTRMREKQIMESADNALKTIGLSNTGGNGLLEVGIDNNGSTVFSKAELANNPDTSTGSQIVNMAGAMMNAMGVFSSQDDLFAFNVISEQAKNPEYHNKLNTLHKDKNIESFIAEFGPVDRVGYLGANLFNKWGNLSPAQKSLAIASAKVQGFSFSDNTNIYDKQVVPNIPGAPSLTVKESLELFQNKLNVVPLTKKWGQYTAVQAATTGAGTAGVEVAELSHAMGMLGVGPEAAAINISEERLISDGATPAPNYGVGALMLPSSAFTPQGYVIAKQMGDKNVVIPQDNADTSIISSPDIASDNALQVYNKWSQDGIKQTAGVLGGSAVVSGLNKLMVFNPAALGAVVTDNVYEQAGAKIYPDDLTNVLAVTGVTLSRLKTGEVNKDIDAKGLKYRTKGPLTKNAFNEVMQVMKREYSNNGITSKEEAYQLANQAYAERRFDESTLVTSQRAADMVFDKSGYTVAAKMRGGKDKGLSLAMVRHGRK